MATTLLFVFVLAASAAARPANNVSYIPVERHGQIDQDSAYILDDMVFVDGQLEQDKAAYLPPNVKKWPLGVVPYVIDPALQSNLGLIMSAMNDYNLKTCVKFIPRVPIAHTNYIKIQNSGRGCYSNVGMTGGVQVVNLGEGCLYRGTVVHELGHALGFIHEQMREDRDQYLTINWQNIQPDMKSQFQKWPANTHEKSPNYDYGSIMQYGEYAFSIDGRSRTMVAKNGQRLYEPYEKQGLTRTDVERVNKRCCPL